MDVQSPLRYRCRLLGVAAMSEGRILVGPFTFSPELVFRLLPFASVHISLPDE